MSFARTAFQYLTTACSPTALYHNVASMLRNAYDFLNPKASPVVVDEWPTTRLAIELPTRPLSVQRSQRRLLKNSSSTRSLTTGSDRSLRTSSFNDTGSNRSLSIRPTSTDSLSTLSSQESPRYKYSHTFNSIVLALYLLTPLIAGAAGGYSDRLGSTSALLCGLSVMINFALFLNIYEAQTDLRFCGIRLHNPNDSIDTDIKKDLLYMLPKALTAAATTALIAAPKSLSATTLITNISLSISLAITWQLAQTYTHRPEKHLTSLSSSLAGCFIMINAALAAFGTFLFLSPVISMGANPPIPNSMPRAFWIPAYILAILALTNFILQTHYKKQSKPLTQWLTRLILLTMNAKSLLGLLYLAPEIAFLRLQPNQDIIDATAHYIMPAAFSLAIIASLFNGPAKDYLKAHQRYLKIIDPTLAGIDARPLSNTEEDLSIWACVKQSAQFPIKLLIYIADVITASTQVQRLLAVPYPSVTSPGSTIGLATIASIMGLLGGLHATLETSANAKESKHPLRFQCGKIIDIAVVATVLTASAAYTLTFPYGVLAIYYNQPLNQLIATGTLPTSDFVNGTILGAAVAFAYFYTAVIKRRPIAEGMVQNSSLVRMSAVRAVLSRTGSAHLPVATTATTSGETDPTLTMATNPFHQHPRPTTPNKGTMRHESHPNT